ncbi:MAG: hypothetical protein ACJ74O_16585 [Frankiaceae bacterium]
MDPIATYSFLPWLRRGIATLVGSAPAGTVRATATVDMTIDWNKLGDGPQSTPLPSREVALYGPGDVIGLDARAIVRMEPRPGITNFEANYLAFVELYDEDLPWRYTPAPPDPAEPTAAKRRLLPWLALVVLAEGEFDDPGGVPPGKPLPLVSVADLDLFPPAADQWAFAHVHVNRGLADVGIESDDAGAVLSRLDGVLAENPDLASSRLLSPRHLASDTAYHAFLMPAFEAGRLAGLGLDPRHAPGAAASAWEPYAGREEPSSFCYYHRWSYRTGIVGDFEQLVRLLRPRVADARVGQRDMDVRHPGPTIPGVTDPALHGVLRLGGALKVPEEDLDADEKADAQRYEDWDQPPPHPFQTALAALVNLADDYRTGAAANPDPVITPPLYGQWHALTSRLLDATVPGAAGNWVHELNLDPRFRVAAGLGTGVVQQNQEAYVAAAWDQVGDVLEANRRIRMGHLAREVAGSWHRRHLAAQVAADPGRVLTLTAPVHRRVTTGGATVWHTTRTSSVGPAPVSAAMRRIARPAARLARAASTDGAAGSADAGSLLVRMARDEITAAPPKQAPSGVPTMPVLLASLAKAARDVPGADLHALELLDDRRLRPDLLANLWHLPGFTIAPVGRDHQVPKRGEEDSPTAARFKAAALDNAELVRASAVAGREEPRAPFDVNGTAAAVLAALHPDVTIPRRVLAGLSVPGRLRDLVAVQFREVMAYPEIDVPMYKPLVDLGTELFVPNLNLIADNSITLLETNRRFIESYLVGLNHEFARELLWREYPTDQQGSYFRQFWDPASQLSLPGEAPEQRRERLRDVPPLHQWTLASALGGHDNRRPTAQPGEEDLILVIRGELLKRYPTAVIYAQRAEWVRDAGGHIDDTSERRLAELTPDEEASPPAMKVRTPLYEAKVDPDVYFFGFDLTAAQARGGTGEHDTDDPGWFFVIRERPGEPRFGLDIERDGPLEAWNDLAWPDALPAGAAFLPVGAGAIAHALPAAMSAGNEKHEQWQDDRALHWGADLTASEVAYILYQAPVLVAVHAHEMLGHG